MNCFIFIFGACVIVSQVFCEDSDSTEPPSLGGLGEVKKADEISRNIATSVSILDKLL